jgi:ferredoxin-type protein NapG
MRSGSKGGLDRRGFFVHGLARALGEAADALAERVAPRRYIRPPGALPEAAFVAACTRCGDCVRACPVAAIAPLGTGEGLAAGTPALAPTLDACIMCAEMPCAAACPTGALTRPGDGWAALRIAELGIDTGRCITYRDVACGICAHACPLGERALSIDASGHPVIGDACSGCGVCISACVTTPSSMTIHPLKEIA